LRVVLDLLNKKLFFMKKLLLSVVVIICFTFYAEAQKGSVLLYGNVGITATSSNSDLGGGTTKQTSSLLNIGLGYQFNTDWTAGVNFQYNYVNTNGVESGYMVDPFLRYSKSISPIFSIYGQFQAGYSHTSVTPNPSDYRANGFNAQLFPAVYINIKNGFGLNFNFGGIVYNSTKEKSNAFGSTNDKTFSVTLGQGAAFGISKNFGGK
jgi:hypothetical protein